MPSQQALLLLELSNLVVGLGMLSVSAAIIVSWLNHKTDVRYKWISMLFGAFFLLAGIGRMVAPLTGLPPSPWEVGINVAAGLIAVAAGIIVWPVSKRTRNAPTYDELQEALISKNNALERASYSQRLFESFMSKIPVLASIRDAEGRITYMNHEWERLTGFSTREMIGLTLSEMHWIPKHLAEEEKRRDEETLQRGEGIEHIAYLPLPSGEYKRWLIARFPLKDNQGKMFVGVIAVDMTVQIEQEQLRAQVAAIVHSSDDAIFSKTLDGMITSWNPGAEKLYGYKPEEVIGQSVAMLAQPDKALEIDDILNRVRNGEHLRDYETLRVGKHGELKDVAVTISPITDSADRIIGAAVIARDVTAKKESENKITRLYDDLKHRIQQLGEANAALQAARDQALEASNLKSAFVANISHELRTPLSGILGMNELLLTQEHPLETLSMLQMMFDSGNTLLAIVNDILDLSKIEAGKVTLEYEPFNPSYLVEDCAKLLIPAASAKHLEFEILLEEELPEYVYGDAARVRQILLNLAGNAIKFTLQGKVTVSARLDRQEENSASLVFSVTDTGIGIGKEEQGLLFVPFTQIDSSSTRKFGGTGLGLTISKRFVDMMGGDIGFESEKGYGSTFWCKIPFDKQPVQQRGMQRESKTPVSGIVPVSPVLASGKKILIVEDNIVLREIAMRQIAALGIKAEMVASGNEAIHLGTSGDFNIILMDVNLPDISGNDATRAIRLIENNTGKRRVPIIAMTAGAMKGDREAAIKSGMDDYLAKPVRIDDLRSALEKWLRKGATEEERRRKGPHHPGPEYYPRSA